VSTALRLLVTRPAEQGQAWVQQLSAKGLDAVALPLITISALADQTPLQQSWLALAQHSLVMFVSANAVQHFFAARPVGSSTWPAGVLAASTGPGTSSALLAAGVPAGSLVQPAAEAPNPDSEALWAQLRHLPWQGRRALVVRGEEGRDWLADTLTAQGAQVSYVAAYRRSSPTPNAADQALLAAALAQPQRHVWLFSSSQAVSHLLAWQNASQPQATWAQSRAYASHPRIAQAAVNAGFGQVMQLAASLDAVVQQAMQDQGH
jgi:uroporphyrinogen-III synthase